MVPINILLVLYVSRMVPMKLAALLLFFTPIAIAQQLALQAGEIVIWDGTQILPQPFLDIRQLVLCCSERGLLSVAFHPQYRTNGRFFVYYVDLNGDLNNARYSVSSDPDRADQNSAQI